MSRSRLSLGQCKEPISQILNDFCLAYPYFTGTCLEGHGHPTVKVIHYHGHIIFIACSVDIFQRQINQYDSQRSRMSVYCLELSISIFSELPH